MAGYNQNPYTIEAGNNFSQGLSGLSNTIENVRQAKLQEAQQQMQQQQMQRQQDQYDRAQQRFQEVQSAAQEAFASQDPDKVAQIAIKYPEVTQMLQQATGLKDDMQNREASEFFSKFATAPPEQRQSIIENRIKSIEGRNGDPSHTQQMLEDFKANPEGETAHLMNFWAGVNPTQYKAYSEGQKAQQKAQIEQQKLDQSNSQFQQSEAGRNNRAAIRNSIMARNGSGAAGGKPTAHMQDYDRYQELLKTDPEGARAFGQASGFVSKEGREISPGAQTRLAKNIDLAVSSENNAYRYNNLADQVDKSDWEGGLYGAQAKEKLKDITGEQDPVTFLRREVDAVKATQATANLPPGSASDADVKIAMGPFPGANANKAQVASWLRGAAKLHKINADFNNFKVDYVSDTGSERGMLQAWKNQGKPGAANPALGKQSAPAVTTQAQFDALPSGTVYTEDGQQYRKP